MAIEYVCKDQDCIASIAAAHGFPTSEAIWQAAENSELRNVRKNPSVLLAGDTVRLPEGTPQGFTIARGKVLRVVAQSPLVRLRVKLSEAWVDPNRSVDAQIRFDAGNPIACKVENGVLDVKLPAGAMRAELELSTPGRGGRTVLELRLGGLPPITTDDGVRARLRSLGYPCDLPVSTASGNSAPAASSGAVAEGEGSEASVEEVDDPLLRCLQAFQRAEQITDDERPYGDITRNKLREVCEENFES